MGNPLSSFAVVFASCSLLLLISGCTLSKATMEERTPDLKYTTSNTIALAIVDNRPFILNGDKDENFEGIGRGGYGIPFDFVKQRDDSKVLFTARFADVVARALKNAGSHVVVTTIHKGSSNQDAIAALLAVPFATGLVINVQNSRIDAGGVRWSYFYDYEVLVVDSKGVVVVTKKYSGEDLDFQREIYHAGSAKGKTYEFPAILDIEYKSRIAELLSDSDTAKALGGTGASIAIAGQAGKDGTERLVALKALLDQGIITQSDYDIKKSEILKSL